MNYSLSLPNLLIYPLVNVINWTWWLWCTGIHAGHKSWEGVSGVKEGVLPEGKLRRKDLLIVSSRTAD